MLYFHPTNCVNPPHLKKIIKKVYIFLIISNKKNLNRKHNTSEDIYRREREESEQFDQREWMLCVQQYNRVVYTST